jgi:hypothetical protein
MQWYRVAIHTNEPWVAHQSATALIEGLGAAYRAAGAPDGVQVYHRPLGPLTISTICRRQRHRL